jgi:alpha-ribazole phosphatase
LTTRFWLIRHGEPVEEAWQRCYGSLDIGLSDNGRRQMISVARHLESEPISAIYTSPLRRASESAQMIASVQHCSCEVISGLREIDFGDFEGLTYDEIAARYPELYRRWMDRPAEVRYPNGESFSDLRARAVSAFEEIRYRNPEQTVAVVGHGGVIRALIAWALGMPDSCLFRLGQDYAAMNLLAWIDGYPTLQLLNHRV